MLVLIIRSVLVRAENRTMLCKRGNGPHLGMKMTEWQPIETAPKDGTAIIGYFCDDEQGSFYQLIGWDIHAAMFDREPSWRNSCNEPWDGFTHWMLLPKMPR